MAEKLTYTGSATVTGGPSLSFSRPLDVTGYDKLNLVIDAGKTAVANLGIDPTKTILRLLAMRSTAYDASLTFELDSAKGTTRPFTDPVIIAGTGAIAILGAVTTITFVNGSKTSVTIDVLVAQDPKP